MDYGAMTLGTINGDAESYAYSVGAKSSRGDWPPVGPSTTKVGQGEACEFRASSSMVRP